MTLTGMTAVAMSPKAGAHGELCGMMAIKAAHRGARRGATRNVVLVPEFGPRHQSRHRRARRLFGASDRRRTPTAASIADACAATLGPDVAAIMLTNPNTCGLFERDIVEIAEAVHEAGAYFYCDGANFNAIVGKVRPGDLGVDAMHINLHKTFSTPHGGGGPGAGPVVLSERLAPFAPVPFGRARRRRLRPRRARARATQAFGRMTRLPRPDGHVRARARLHAVAWRRRPAPGVRGRGAHRQLRARRRLSDLMTAPFGDRPCMHEALFDDRWLKDTGVTTLDFAKAMIDEGYPSDDHLFPAGRAWRDADRADRIGIRRRASTCSS